MGERRFCADAVNPEWMRDEDLADFVADMERQVRAACDTWRWHKDREQAAFTRYSRLVIQRNAARLELGTRTA